jgi:hypothetical protein
MTILGKILVFLNLVFSLVVGGLVMVVFMTRTNWEKAYNDQKAVATAVIADRDQVVAEKNAQKLLDDDRYNAAIKERDDAVAALKNAQDETKRAVAELDLFKKGDRKAAAEVTAIDQSNKVQKELAAEFEKQVAAERAEKLKVIAEKNDERAKRIQAEVNMNTYKSKAVALEEQVKDLARELVKSTAGPTGVVVARKKGDENPPRDNVEGKVVRVDGEDNLVSLSIGSDAGLQPGHTLKVFRLHPIPEQSRYLGIIEILTVRPHEAVGRPLKAMSTQMKPGDRVASRLIVGN